MQRYNRNAAYPYLITICILIALHRAVIFLFIRGYFHQQILDNFNWFTWQYLPADVLQHDLLRSLIYLQQTPPFASLLMGLGLKLLDWPNVTYFLLILQVILTVLSALLMLVILSRFTQRHLLAFIWVCIFVFGSDLLVMEYDGLAQNFYENLSMCILLLCVLTVLCWLENHRLLHAFLVGLLVGLLALTRATYSYLFLVPLLGLLLYKPQKLKNHLACYIVGVLLLQGGWTIKNYVVYDYLSPATSSWQGLNLTVALKRAGLETKLVEVIHDNPKHYPDWFSRLIKEHGCIDWGSNSILYPYLPESIMLRDAAIDSNWQHNPESNRLAIRALSQVYTIAYLDFLYSHPHEVFKKFLVGYAQMWLPLHSYSNIALAFFHTDAPLALITMAGPAPSWKTIHDYMVAYMSTEKIALHIRQGNVRHFDSSIPAGHLTLGVISGFGSFINLIFFNFITPVTLLFCLLSRKITRSSILGIGLIVVYVCISYLAFVSSWVELGENTRFRLSVEPLIWISTFATIALIFESFSRKTLSSKPVAAT